MNTLIAAGISGGSRSWWTADRERLVRVRSVDGEEPVDRRVLTALRLPVPGAGRPLAMQVDSLTVLTTRDMWRLDPRVQRWRPVGYLEDNMVDEYLDGWATRDGNAFVRLTPARTLESVSTAGVVSPFTDMPIPGRADVLLVIPETKQAVLDNGERYMWLGSTWAKLGSPVESADGPITVVRCRALRSFACEIDGKVRDVAPGDEFDLSESEMRRLAGMRRVEPVADAVTA
jgi:hypothetical protein